MSGNLVVTLDTAGAVRARTTSGDMHFEGKLKRGATFEAATVSGDLTVRAPSDGGFTYEVSTFSGDIKDCFDKASAPAHGADSPSTGTRGAGAATCA